jgi:hypothetical protein
VTYRVSVFEIRADTQLSTNTRIGENGRRKISMTFLGNLPRQTNRSHFSPFERKS